MLLRRKQTWFVLKSSLWQELRGVGYGASQVSRHDSRAYSGPTADSSARRAPIGKILVANRGEIACRIMKTARRLGLRCVAVYSEADKNSLHVAMADEAICIGPPSAKSSYLNAAAIVDASVRTQANAIHPGYGFLSENAQFAELCKQEGITFIGPPVNAIRAMGDKSESKTLMSAAGVPVVPGYHGQEQNASFLKSQADIIGYPVIIKATQGGGGKGMKIVIKSEDFLENLYSAQREALTSFGDQRVLVEKYILEPRHIEVQVFGDQHGNVVHLFERDCSVQRRHQKIIEEAPAPNINSSFRDQIGQAAVNAAKAVGYFSAGTVEFIVDSVTKDFYFMEMNTRLQVEHPVTEMITSQDLVEWQIRVAAGEPLPCRQNDLSILGHSFEARIYAENIESGFLPAAGVLHHFRPPDASSTVRVETGVNQGDAVSIYYDPMIAKLVVWGYNRSAALLKLHDCLSKFQISGIPTNIGFLKTLSQHPAFSSGEVGTHFIDRYKSSLLCPVPEEIRLKQVKLSAALAACCVCVKDITKDKACSDVSSSTAGRGWASLHGFRLNHELECRVVLNHGQEGDLEMSVAFCKDGSCEVKVQESDNTTTVQMKLDQSNESAFTATIDGVTSYISSSFYKKDCVDYVDIWFNDNHHEFLLVKQVVDAETRDIEPSGFQSSQKAKTGMHPLGVHAPMAGRLVRVLVQNGAKVNKDDPLLILEAMKMEHVVRAPRDGFIKGLALDGVQHVKDNSMLLIVDDHQES
ncbi:hypothetical protein GOP47_0004886 [Adiantum capillus-veneris]|uniref:Methylcrotonoyl-CoA carboxylase subunit alpha, mitochondrial n=1 Tax=Adiantum capillus-veneris TaxID=13818 RepID=A0A9D4V5P9_ADICA|nr:hypothetical protein GOP47_0004886 [Adiantum capillus-veneris]